MLITLTAAAVVSTTFAFRASRAAAGEGRARDAAERVTAFLGDMITSAGTYRTGRHVTVLEMLDAAADRVDTVLAGQPEVEAGVRYSIGRAYTQMCLWGDAIPQLKRALARNREVYGEEHPATADCLNLLGRALTVRGNAAAVSLQKQALSIRRKLHGPNHRTVAESLGDLAFALWKAVPNPQWSEAEKHYNAALAIHGALSDARPADVGRCTYGLAAMYARQDRLAESEKLFRESLDLFRRATAESGTEDAHMVHVMTHFAELLQRRGKTEEASEVLRESLDMTPEGIASSRAYDAKWRLGAIHHQAREFVHAEQRYRESLAMQCRWYTRDFPEHSTDLLQLEARLLAQSTEEGGYPYAEAFRAINELRQWGVLEYLRSIHDLGDVLQHTDPAAGEKLLHECLRLARKYVSPFGWFLADVESIRGGCLTSLGRYEDAEPLLLESFPYIATAPTLRQVRLHEALQRIVSLYEAWDKPERAQTYRAMMPST